MNHSTMHDAGHDTVVEVVHFKSNALEETYRVNFHEAIITFLMHYNSMH